MNKCLNYVLLLTEHQPSSKLHQLLSLFQLILFCIVLSYITQHEQFNLQEPFLIFPPWNLELFSCVFWNKNKMPQWIISCFCIKDTVSTLFYMYSHTEFTYKPAWYNVELISKALWWCGGWWFVWKRERQGSSATFQKNESK